MLSSPTLRNCRYKASAGRCGGCEVPVAAAGGAPGCCAQVWGGALNAMATAAIAKKKTGGQKSADGLFGISLITMVT